MPVRRVAIVGAGTMGSGIAQVVAQSGYGVTLIDIVQEQLDRGLASIERGTQRLVDRERMDADSRRECLARIETSCSLADAAACDLAIEAVTERQNVKSEVLTGLDAAMPSDAVLATNTSSLSITRLAAVTSKPSRFVGIHFMNPAPVMRLVEIVRGLQTDEATVHSAVEWVNTLNKRPVVVNDNPGFALNRLLIPMINEAAFLVSEGVATPEDIDTVMALGANHPLGPLALADLIGIDVCLAIMQVLHDDLGDDKYRPCPLLRRMVSAGWLGRKSGHGFYCYDE